LSVRGKKRYMNKEEPYRDQAERLKRRIEKMNENTVESDLLPPREQVHRQKKKKTKFKLKYPVIRLLVLFFILLPIIYFSVISYLDGKKINRTEKTTGNAMGYETINIDNNSKKKVQQSNDNSLVSEETQQDEKQSGAVTQKDQTESTNRNTDTDTNTNTDTTNTNTNTNTNSTSNSDTNQTTTKENVQSNSTPQKADTSTKIIYHTVKPQETLYKIAMKYYYSIDGVEIIKEANHLKSEQITVGQVLKIPLKN
jgi:LysM repeat protein